MYELSAIARHSKTHHLMCGRWPWCSEDLYTCEKIPHDMVMAAGGIIQNKAGKINRNSKDAMVCVQT